MTVPRERMDPTLRAGIVALLQRGYAIPEIADLLDCPQQTVARVQHVELVRPTAPPSAPIERWAAGKRGHYDEDLNRDIRIMLAEDRPVATIAKECRVSEATVRAIRQHDCPHEIGQVRIEGDLMGYHPFRLGLGKAGYALRFEVLAACYDDCRKVGGPALVRFVRELDELLADKALPEALQILLASTLTEYRQRRLSALDLGARLEEIRARIGARFRPDEPAPPPAPPTEIGRDQKPKRRTA